MHKHLPPQAKLTETQQPNEEFSILAIDGEAHSLYALHNGSELLARTADAG